MKSEKFTKFEYCELVYGIYNNAKTGFSGCEKYTINYFDPKENKSFVVYDQEIGKTENPFNRLIGLLGCAGGWELMNISVDKGNDKALKKAIFKRMSLAGRLITEPNIIFEEEQSK